MALQAEIDRTRKEIRTDSYGVSIGEWISLYEQNEIDIHPEFQRFFRWSSFQKSRLIESILLGIPIPPIFVSQRPDGIWDVVDGLQRLSTIYELAGVLRDEDDNVLAQLVLEETKYLPSLKGMQWENEQNPALELSRVQKLIIKRSKIDVSIILRESDEKAKYELFQRLNTGGSPLSEQEVRNSILVMQDRSVFVWLRDLSQNEDFRECIALTDRAIEEQYDMELVLRFVLLRTLHENELRNIGDINDYLTNKMVEVVSDKKINRDEESEAFHRTFRVLRAKLGNNSFHKYVASKSRFEGGFLISAYELIALGVGYNFVMIDQFADRLEEIVKELWTEQEFVSKSGSGVRASSRIPITLRIGRRAFT